MSYKSITEKSRDAWMELGEGLLAMLASCMQESNGKDKNDEYCMSDESALNCSISRIKEHIYSVCTSDADNEIKKIIHGCLKNTSYRMQQEIDRGY